MTVHYEPCMACLSTVWRDPAMNHRSAGFTLLELMIAMAIFALVMSMGLAAMRLGSSSVMRLDRSSAVGANQRIAYQALRTVIQDALSPSLCARQANRREVLQATADRFTFCLFRPPGVLPGGIYMATIAVEEQLGSRSISLTLAPLQGSGAALFQSESRVLLGHVAEAQLSYYGAPQRLEEGSWFAQWPSTLQLPRLVRVAWRKPGQKTITYVFPIPQAR